MSSSMHSRKAPWLSRPDWAKGQIQAQENASSVIGLGLFGSIATMAAAYLFFSPKAAYLEQTPKWIVLFFGVAFLSGAIYVHLLRRKFGKSLLQLNTVPGVIGGALEGTIKIGAAFPDRSTFQIHLQCLKLQSRKTGDEMSTTGKVIWESGWQAALGKSDSKSCLVPIHFEVPQGYPESEAEHVPNRILWQLSAKAIVPGLDYMASFDVPMFTGPFKDEEIAKKASYPNL